MLYTKKLICWNTRHEEYKFKEITAKLVPKKFALLINLTILSDQFLIAILFPKYLDKIVYRQL
jgi:hypothetical protein